MHKQSIELTKHRAAVASPRHHIRTAADLFTDPSIHPRKPIFGDWLLERGLAMVYAPSGIGKSWLSLSIATAVAGGGSLHEWNTPSAERVLLVDGEMDASDIKDRLGIVFDAVKGDREKAQSNLLIWARKDPLAGKNFLDLATPEGREWLLEVVDETKPKLLVLDNLSTLAAVTDENAAQSWDPVLGTLQAVQQAGCAVLLVLCKIARRDEIEAQDWSLNPGRYVGAAPGQAHDDEEFKEKLEALQEELEALNADAAQLQASIGQNVANLLDS
jgi:hypothetical protein